MSQAPAVIVDLQLAVGEHEFDGQPLPASHQLEAWVAAALVGAAQDGALDSGSTLCELTVRLVEEEESQGLNRDYRGKDYSTNVLSFPHEPLDLDDFTLPPELAARFAEEDDDDSDALVQDIGETDNLEEESPEDVSLTSGDLDDTDTSFEPAEENEQRFLGDLIISVHVVAREAREQGKSLEAHFAHMLVHGTLHLLSYDHIEDDEAERMEALERHVLAGLGFADPYREENH
ncbi:rRNA maturation RNase YbeY [Cobetia sp. L2A1]|uniref:rRNA maturation RNase YbeY n=1 Tax=Cobetia sp. L2A1 TaxID=2686360 RepID=UPI00131E5C38|nr:rRNA maturation RNase YbeY [Cobetia sp. L2A1]